MKLLTYTHVSVSAGLSHQKSNLTAMLREAALCGRDLVVPQFHLCGTHNHGRELVSQLDEYFDLDRIEVGGRAVRIFKSAPADSDGTWATVARHESLLGCTENMIAKEMKGVALVRLPLEAVYEGFRNVPVEIPTHGSLRRAAEEMIGHIPPDAAWVHVRRGDRLDKTARATDPGNIRRVLQKVAPETRSIYIATNETNPGFSEPLKEYYQVTCMADFSSFRALGSEDNYKLFLVEQTFGGFFPIRISTFKVKGDYFHGSLCESPGWQ